MHQLVSKPSRIFMMHESCIEHARTRFFCTNARNKPNPLGRTINALQAFAFLETVHCYFGFTGGKVFTNFVQAFGRALILVYLSCNSRAQNSEFVFLLFASWCFADIIRYPYYLFTVSILIL